MAILLLRLPDGENREIKLSKVKTSIGRSSRNDVCINDPFASRLHAEVRREDQTYYLTDLGSANGTFCNGVKVTGTVQLNLSDLVQIGETKINVLDEVSPVQPAGITLSDENPQADGLTITKRNSDIFSVLEEVTGSGQGLAKTSGYQAAADTIISPPSEKMSRKRDNLLAIVSKVGVTLLSDASLDDTLKLVMDLVFDAIPAERGFLFLSSNWTLKKG